MSRTSLHCEDCKYVIPLWPENAEALQFINKIGPGLVARDGINGALLETAFNIYEVPKEMRVRLFEKINVYASVLFEHWANETRNG